MKKLLILFVSISLSSAIVIGQPERVGVGLTFATKRSFNGGETDNPGLNVKTWIAVDKRRTFHIVPSFTFFKPHEISHTSYFTTNYMLHANLDLHYMVLHHNTLKLVAIAGLNYTRISSKNEILVNITNQPVVDLTDSGFGPEIGAALEMRMGSSWNFIFSGKYTFAGIQAGDPALEQRLLIAPLSSPVLQVLVAYYFTSRKRGYSRR